MSTDLKWTSQSRKLSQLKPATYNPRKLSPEQEKRLTDSIAKFDVCDPIIINADDTIIGGHQRIKVLSKQGVESVDVRVPSRQLSIEEEKELNVRLNKNLGEWDFNILKDFDMNMLKDVGFDSLELDKIFPVTSDEKDDDVPDVKEETTTKTGDIFQLGRHRVMCGDSTDAGSVAVLMDGKKADMVFTDPPYLLNTEGGCKGDIGKSIKKYNKSIEFISDFNPEKFLEVLPVLFNGNTINAYVFCNKDLLPDYLSWAKSKNFSFNVLIWKKPNAVPIGDSHRPDIEYLILFRKSAIWNNAIDGVTYSRCLEFGRESGLHPTMKPVSLIANEIFISSNRDSVVFDLFLGSGSTIIACEKTNRICYGMEIDPNYVDVIVKRWEDFTGQKAIKLSGEEVMPNAPHKQA